MLITVTDGDKTVFRQEGNVVLISLTEMTEDNNVNGCAGVILANEFDRNPNTARLCLAVASTMSTMDEKMKSLLELEDIATAYQLVQKDRRRRKHGE